MCNDWTRSVSGKASASVIREISKARDMGLELSSTLFCYLTGLSANSADTCQISEKYNDTIIST